MMKPFHFVFPGLIFLSSLQICKAFDSLDYQSIKTPVNAAKLFRECDTNQLKPGTSRSGLCDHWDQHIAYLENRLKKDCVASGENIYKTIVDVDGFFLKQPYTGPDISRSNYRPNHLHLQRIDTNKSEYVSPATSRLYRAFEYYSLRHKAYEKHFIKSISKGTVMNTGKHVPKVETDFTLSDMPTMRYQVEYEDLTTNDDHGMGYYGDLTRVIDRETGELLAERTIFYYVIKPSARLPEGTILSFPGKYYAERYFQPCENYVPRITKFETKHPTTEYEFVSRVLIPKTFTDEENKLLYDLAIGSGKIKRDCVGLQTLGPGINPENLQVVRIDNDLSLTINNASDSLTCRRFFTGPHWDLKLLFSDGAFWQEKRVLDHGNIIWEKNE